MMSESGDRRVKIVLITIYIGYYKNLFKKMSGCILLLGYC